MTDLRRWHHLVAVGDTIEDVSTSFYIDFVLQGSISALYTGEIN